MDCPRQPGRQTATSRTWKTDDRSASAALAVTMQARTPQALATAAAYETAPPSTRLPSTMSTVTLPTSVREGALQGGGRVCNAGEEGVLH